LLGRLLLLPEGLVRVLRLVLQFGLLCLLGCMLLVVGSAAG
jgi:hypothetical protein